MKTLAFFAALVAAVFLYQRSHAPLIYPPGVLIAAEPIQTEAASDEVPLKCGKFRLKALAHFELDARVLHRRIYRYDREAELVPVDLAVGWGAMSDQTVLDQLEISQSARFFWYEYQGAPPIPPDQIISHATNLHLIPATQEIRARCSSLRAGELIHLAGFLVEATSEETGTWRSSLSRTDTGNGACELVWVEELHTLAHRR